MNEQYTAGSLFAGAFKVAIWYNIESRRAAPTAGDVTQHYQGVSSVNDSTPTKRCGKCGVQYPATSEYFRKSNKYKTGLGNRCRICCRAEAKLYRDANVETVKTSRRNFYKRHPGYSTRYSKPEAQKLRSQAYYTKNKSHVLEQSRRRKKANPETTRLQRRVDTQRRRARIKQVGGTHTKEQALLRLNEQSGFCYWCNQALNAKWEIDHYIPLSRGGSNDISNIVISCPSCNRSKHNHLPSEWGGRS